MNTAITALWINKKRRADASAASALLLRGIFALYQRPRFLGDFLLVLGFFSVEEELEDGLELLELLELLGLLVNFLGAKLAGLGLESISRVRLGVMRFSQTSS